MSPKFALVLVMSEAHSDPRVRRQIDWLTSAGWTVDTIGLGPHPSAQVREHFELDSQSPWVRSRAGAAIIYGLLPHSWQFRLLVSDRIPAKAKNGVRDGSYDLIFFNEPDFAPLVNDTRDFTSASRRAHVHLDIHEYREKKLSRITRWQRLTANYSEWRNSLVGSPDFDTRSTVASRIAELYAADFGIEPPILVRNSPPYFHQAPSPVDPDNIRLIFHGLASRARGLQEVMDAMAALEDRFTATFMLTGNPAFVAELQEKANALGGRLTIVPPVPMTEISTAINQYDLEVMFYPPRNKNVILALPNKFFEAIQGRLGLVIGESPMMEELVNEHGNGIVIRGWTAADLSAELNKLSTEEIREFKAASHRAARVLNAEKEGAVLLSALANSDKHIDSADSLDHG